MTDVIDGFSHVFTREFADEMAEVNPSPELERYEDPSFDRLWDDALAERIDDMDEFGIDRQVICLAQPAVWRDLAPDTALRLARIANDSVRSAAEEYPDRLVPVGTIPRLDGEFVDELDRCVTDLGMAGVQIFSNVDGRPIDAEPFRPFYDRVESHGVPVWIHPQLYEWTDWAYEYFLHKSFGWPFDTTLALARLVYSGIMERHPDLHVIAHHMAGMVPQFAHRAKPLREIQDMYIEDTPELSMDPRDYFTRFYGDTSLRGDLTSIERGLEFFGPDHVVFGVDYPLGPENGRAWLRATVEDMADLDVSDDDREAICGGTLESLIGG